MPRPTTPAPHRTPSRRPPARRVLSLAVALALGCGAAPALHAQTCWLVKPDGSYIRPAASVFGRSCSLNDPRELGGNVTALGTTSITGVVTKADRIWNEGLWSMQGYSDSGRLDNRGTVRVGSGAGPATVRRSGNLSADGTVLLHGAWQVVAAPGLAATLDLAISPGQRVTTNQADLLISGAQARFVGLDQLSDNRGTLGLADGFDGFGGALNPGLRNTGTLAVRSGARAQVGASPSALGGWLREGHWIVDDSGNGVGTKTQLDLGVAITRNSATVSVRGPGASFVGLGSLQVNEGHLTVAEQSFSVASLLNTGTLTAGDGGSIRIGSPGNVSGTTLGGGTWRVEGSGSFALGVDRFATNDATVVLSGAGASFAQFSGLSRNQGTLAVENGAVLAFGSPLANVGTLQTATGGVLQVAPSVQVTHDGLVRNGGQLRVEGALVGLNGRIDNTGLVVVSGNGTASFAGSAQRDGSTLTGGAWRVEGSGKLTVGSGRILANAADVVLSGNAAAFAQLDGLASNTGSLTITGGRTQALEALHNTGTLVVSDGSRATVGGKANLRQDASGQALGGGQWQVLGSVDRPSSLAVGKGDIVTNDGSITFGGEGARFEQIATLKLNNGALSFTDGARFSPVEGFFNAGSLSVGAGSSVTLKPGPHLARGTLTGGHWELRGEPDRPATLAIGTGTIQVNDASIVLGHADFAQIEGLQENRGSLTLTDGAVRNFGKVPGAAAFMNSGQITVASGARLVFANLAPETFDGGWLKKGQWVVDAGNGAATALVIETAKGAIPPVSGVGRDASLVLRGAQAQFAQFGAASTAGASIVTVEGSLSVLDGHTMHLVNPDPSTGGLAAVSFEQRGRLTVGAGSELRLSSSSDGSAQFVQSGIHSLTQVDGVLYSRGSTDFDEGEVHGNGIIAAGVALDLGRARLSPGGPGADRTGHLVLTAGAISFTPDSTLLLDLASPTDFDTLEVRGILDWASTATLQFDLGFVPTAASYRFEVLTISELREGSPLRSLTLPSIAGYDARWTCQSESCALVLSAVPEPGTWALWMAGLAGVGFVARRRRPAVDGSL